MPTEAMLYDKLADHEVACRLCAHNCKIKPGKLGVCRVRENRDGVLYSLVYDKVISANLDPIEKKPFFNFLPGSKSFSIAAPGCNFRCDHCQNWSISQAPRDRGFMPGSDISPQEIVGRAVDHLAASIAYTYTEPTIFFELAFDVARLAHEDGIKNCFVTNGYQSEDAIVEIEPYLDAANIDLKSFSDETYRKGCGARLQPVLDTIESMRKKGIWVEVTTLIIPGENDSAKELGRIAGFLAELDIAIPWHVSAFHPDYKLTDRPPTTGDKIIEAVRIGQKAGLRYVYSGNIRGGDLENTICHNCGAGLIERIGYTIKLNRIESGRCPECAAEIDGVWQ